MAIEEIRTFLDVQNAVLKRAKLEDKEEVRTFLKEKINTAYQQVGFEEAYRWSGVTYPLKLRAKYATGTVALTNGSDLVTGTSTVWTQNAHEGLKFFVTGVNTPYTILRISEGDQVATLSAPWTGTTGTGLAYGIYKDEYGLYPDFMDLRKFWIPGMNHRAKPMPCGPNELDELRGRYPFRSGPPIRYTINGYNIYTEKTWATFNLNTDFWEDNYDAQPRNHNLVLWPCMPTTNTTAMLRYTRILPMLSNDADEPLIPYEVRARLVYEVLLEHFVVNRDRDTKREWKEKRDEIKKQMACDIETTDDELVLTVDRSIYSRQSSFAIDNYDCEN